MRHLTASPGFTRQAALITGGACRIGRAVALDLAALGYDIALHYRSSSREARATAADIEKCGVCCALFKATLNDGPSGIRLVRAAASRFPRLTVLVHGASDYHPSGLSETDLPALRSNMGVHVDAAWGMGAAFRSAAGQGNIVHFLDTRITRDHSTHAAYLLSKKTLAALVRMTALDFAPDIRVNAIAPGVILPPAGTDAGYIRRRTAATPLRRAGHPGNITGALRFLLQNDYITGQTIFVDGGDHLV